CALETPDVSVCQQRRWASGNKSRAAARGPWPREHQRLVKSQLKPVRQNNGALDDVRELADVTRPIILFKGLDVGRSQARHGSLQALTRQSQEVCRQECDVVLASAKRGQFNRKQAQTIIEILAESPGLHLTFQESIVGDKRS